MCVYNVWCLCRSFGLSSICCLIFSVFLCIGCAIYGMGLSGQPKQRYPLVLNSIGCFDVSWNERIIWYGVICSTRYVSQAVVSDWSKLASGMIAITFLLHVLLLLLLLLSFIYIIIELLLLLICDCVCICERMTYIRIQNDGSKIVLIPSCFTWIVLVCHLYLPTYLLIYFCDWQW